MGINTQQYIEKKNYLNQFQKQLNHLYDGKSDNDFFIATKDIPELQLDYIRLFRELEIQNQTLTFVYPIFEQARIDEKKSMPTVIVINEAYVPQKKHTPKRSLIVIGIVFFTFWIIVGFIFRGEKVLKQTERYNIVEEKEFKFFQKIIKKFKIDV